VRRGSAAVAAAKKLRVTAADDAMAAAAQRDARPANALEALGKVGSSAVSLQAIGAGSADARDS
jgi:hypothetical protein